MYNSIYNEILLFSHIDPFVTLLVHYDYFFLFFLVSEFYILFVISGFHYAIRLFFYILVVFNLCVYYCSTIFWFVLNCRSRAVYYKSFILQFFKHLFLSNPKLPTARLKVAKVGYFSSWRRTYSRFKFF